MLKLKHRGDPHQSLLNFANQLEDFFCALNQILQVLESFGKRAQVIGLGKHVLSIKE